MTEIVRAPGDVARAISHASRLVRDPVAHCPQNADGHSISWLAQFAEAVERVMADLDPPPPCLLARIAALDVSLSAGIQGRDPGSTGAFPPCGRILAVFAVDNCLHVSRMRIGEN